MERSRFHLSHRTCCVSLGDSCPPLLCSLRGPTGFNAGPFFLFSLYLLPVGSVLSKRGILFHNQLYVLLKQTDSFSVIDFKNWKDLCAFKSLNVFPHRTKLSWSPRSADQLLLRLPKTRLKLRGDRAFAVATPKLWNELPLHIRQASSPSIF